MVREVKIQTEKGGQRKKNDLKEKSFSFRVPDKKKKKGGREGEKKKHCKINKKGDHMLSQSPCRNRKDL